MAVPQKTPDAGAIVAALARSGSETVPVSGEIIGVNPFYNVRKHAAAPHPSPDESVRHLRSIRRKFNLDGSQEVIIRNFTRPFSHRVNQKVDQPETGEEGTERARLA